MRWILLLVAVAAVVAWRLDRGLIAPQPVPAAAGPELPRYALSGAEWVRFDARGQPEMRARAGALDYYADASVQLRELTLDHLGGEGSPWTLSAPRGEVPAGERRVRLLGGVQAQGRYADDPVRFTTETLWVDLFRRELRTDAPVLLAGEFRRASAVGLRADFSGASVQLLDQVQVDYVPGR